MSGWKVGPFSLFSAPAGVDYVGEAGSVEHFQRGEEIVFEGETLEELFEKMRAAGLLAPEPEGDA